ncbi:MAG: methyltransferase domain-containing protein [Candidatus Acidiferrales bacterium]
MTNASPQPAKPWLDSIRRDWDARARDDARAYINWPDVPNEEDAFFASGKADYDRYVPTFLKKMNFDPRDKVALEIGCGIGRIARWMSQDFARYIGVDVSPEMIHKASSYNFPRAEFHAVSGGDLAGVADHSVDFVWSFAVFQHVPDQQAIFNYFRETARVLRPGGIFRLHMKGLWTLPLGRLMLEAGFPDHSREGKGRRGRMPFVRLRYLDTWQGRSIRPDEAGRQCAAAGLEVLDTEGEWTPMMWIGGRKK